MLDDCGVSLLLSFKTLTFALIQLSLGGSCCFPSFSATTETCLSGLTTCQVGLGQSGSLGYISILSLAMTSPSLAFFRSTMFTVSSKLLIVKLITYLFRFMYTHPKGFKSPSLPNSRPARHSMQRTPISARYLDSFSILLLMLRWSTASRSLREEKVRVSISLPQSLVLKKRVELGLLRYCIWRCKESSPAMECCWQPGGTEGSLWRSLRYQLFVIACRDSGSFIFEFDIIIQHLPHSCISTPSLNQPSEQCLPYTMTSLKTQGGSCYAKEDVVLAKVGDEFPWPAKIIHFKGFTLNKDIGVDEDYYQVRFFDQETWVILYNYQLTPLTLARIAQLRKIMSSNKVYLGHLNRASKQIQMQRDSLGGILLERHLRLYEKDGPTLLPLEEYFKKSPQFLKRICEQRQQLGVMCISTERQLQSKRRKRYNLCSRHTYMDCTILITTYNGEIAVTSHLNGLTSHSLDPLLEDKGLDDTQDQLHPQLQPNKDIDALSVPPVSLIPEAERTLSKEKGKKIAKEVVSQRPEKVARERIKAIIEYIELSLGGQCPGEGKGNYEQAVDQVRLATEVLACTEQLTSHKLEMFLENLNDFSRLFQPAPLAALCANRHLSERLRVLPLATLFLHTLSQLIDRLAPDPKHPKAKCLIKQSASQLQLTLMKKRYAELDLVVADLRKALVP